MLARGAGSKTVLYSFLAAIALGGCNNGPQIDRDTSPEVRTGIRFTAIPKSPELKWSAAESVARILEDGRHTNSREIGYLVDCFKFYGKSKSLFDAPERERLTLQAKVLESERLNHPEVIRFKFGYDKSTGLFHVTPIDRFAERAISTEEGDLAVFGNELASVTSAMVAADRGMKVVLVYDGALGGLLSDEGGNLRLFDRPKYTTHIPQLSKIFDTAGMKRYVDIPKGLSDTIHGILRDEYKGRIQLVKTGSLFSSTVILDGNRVTGVRTAEGNEVHSKYFMDTTPDGTLAEKTLIKWGRHKNPLSFRGTQLGDGLVFDVGPLGEDEFARLDKKVSPGDICRALGLQLDDVLGNPRVKQKYDAMMSEPAAPGTFISVSNGFQFFMACQELRNDDPLLKQLNDDRLPGGWNGILIGDQAHFNGINYKIPYQKLQGGFSIETDGDLKGINKYERSGLQEYFKIVLGDPSIETRLPKELYIRRATAEFAPEVMDKVLEPAAVRWNPSNGAKNTEVSYGNDYRASMRRDNLDKREISPPGNNTYRAGSGGLIAWDVDPRLGKVRYLNLYIVSKCLPPKGYFGASRIVLGQINQGAAIARSISPLESENPFKDFPDLKSIAQSGMSPTERARFFRIADDSSAPFPPIKNFDRNKQGVSRVGNYVRALFSTDIFKVEGWRTDIVTNNKTSDHAEGRALDFYPREVDDRNGDKIAQWFVDHIDELKKVFGVQVKYVIWKGKIWDSRRGHQAGLPYTDWKDYTPDSGIARVISTMHQDHIHVSFWRDDRSK